MKSKPNAPGGLSAADIEALRVDIAKRYASDDDPEMAEHVWDATRNRLILDAGTRESAKAIAQQQLRTNQRQSVSGLDFLTNRPQHLPLWGDGDSILWARGQGMLLVGPQGVGKSTVEQRLILARIGAAQPSLFGYSVMTDQRPVLYLAMDRPDQISDSMARMVDTSDPGTADLLKARLKVWEGHPPFKADLDPDRFAEFVANEGGDPGAVVFDSVKDMMSNVVSDEAGLAFNETVQRILANGTDTVGNHHQRKGTALNSKPNTLSDVYGSAWITSGHGSIVLLWGEAGARTVELKHLKPVRIPVGPLTVNYDHATGGAVGGNDRTLIRELAENTGDSGFTIDDAVLKLRNTTRPDPTWRKDRQAVDRLLTKMVAGGLLVKHDGKTGGFGGGADGPVWTRKADDDGTAA